jgi:parvin
VLLYLAEKLSNVKLDCPEVTQSEEGQKQKLHIVLAASNKVLGYSRWPQSKWSVEKIHGKNLVSILHLLVALARHFRAPVRLPENVVVNILVVRVRNATDPLLSFHSHRKTERNDRNLSLVQKRDGILVHEIVEEEITSTYDDLGLRGERDAFDTLFDHAPDKLMVVKKVSAVEITPVRTT